MIPVPIWTSPFSINSDFRWLDCEIVNELSTATVTYLSEKCNVFIHLRMCYISQVFHFPFFIQSELIIRNIVWCVTNLLVNCFCTKGKEFNWIYHRNTFKYLLLYQRKIKLNTHINIYSVKKKAFLKTHCPKLKQILANF